MPHYEVKAWITVEADGDAEAEALAAEFLDSAPHVAHVVYTSIEGEGSTYEVEPDD
jgi:hypothetical protein